MYILVFSQANGIRRIRLIYLIKLLIQVDCKQKRNVSSIFNLSMYRIVLFSQNRQKSLDWRLLVGGGPPVVCSVVRIPAGILTKTTALLLHQLITGVLLLGRIEICPSILTNTLEYNPMQWAG